MLYYQSMYKILKTRKEETHPNLKLIFHFFSTFSLLDRVTLSRSSFVQTNIFSKKKTLSLFWLFSTWYIFSTTFIPDMSIFFLPIFNNPKVFFWRKRIKHSFFRIFFYSKWNTILLRKKKWNEKLLFFVFFSKIQNIFFLFRPKSNFQVLMTSWNLLTQKQENIFSIFSLQKINTNVSNLLTYKRNIRTEVSLHVS